MSKETTDSKIQRAAEDIGGCISVTLLTMAPRLAKKFKLTDGQLAVAFVSAQMQLLAAGATGIILGNGATDDEMLETSNQLIRGIQPVIGAALEIPD